jgi:hypothetical protein
MTELIGAFRNVVNAPKMNSGALTYAYMYTESVIRAMGICRQTPTTHIISTTEPLYVISIKYRLSLPDVGSYVIRNMLEYILMCVF